VSAEEALRALSAELRWKRRRPATIKQYQIVVGAFWRALEGWGIPWDQAPPDALDRWLDRRPKGNAKGAELSEHAKAHYSGLILGAYKVLVDLDVLPANPLRRVARYRDPEPIPRALTLTQVAALLDVAREDAASPRRCGRRPTADARVEVLVWLAFGAGLRVGELAALRVEDVQLGDHPQMEVCGKGGRRRVVPLSPPLPEVFAAWLARPDVATRGPLVPALRGGHMSSRTIQYLLGGAMRRAGIPGTPHSLRHTYATELLRAGKGSNLLAVSKLLGHRSVRTTERVYVNGYQEDKWQTAALLPDPRGPR